MAWTAVHTFAVGDVLNASDLNTWLSNNTQWLFQPPSCRVTNSLAYTIATATATVCGFNTERWKQTDSGQHNNSTNNSHLVAITGGVYFIQYQMEWAFAAGGNARNQTIRLNGATPLALSAWIPTPAAGSSGGPVETIQLMAANDYTEVVVIHDQGGNITINRTPNQSPEGMQVWMSN